MATIAPAYPAKGIRARGLPAGSRAPPFSLPSSPDGSLVTADRLRGAPTLLIFYPGDFTPVCSNELSVFNELSAGLKLMGARQFGISVDPLGSHVAFAQQLNLQFPLLSDFHPKGEVSRRFEVYREEDGITERALFVLDAQGTIAWQKVGPIEQNLAPGEALSQLERLTGRAFELPTEPLEIRP